MGSSQISTAKEINRNKASPRNLTLLFFFCLGGIVRFYSTIRAGSSGSSFSLNCKGKLHPWFLSGFIDAEGCFFVSIVKQKTGWSVRATFQITLHQKDLALLKQIQAFLGVGGITLDKSKGCAHYRVQSIKDLKVVIDHLEKYPLMTQKWADYLLWKRVVDLLIRKEHLTSVGLQIIVNI